MMDAEIRYVTNALYFFDNLAIILLCLKTHLIMFFVPISITHFATVIIT